MLNIAIEAVGWLGAASVVIAYLMISTGRLTGRSVTYQLLNAAGGCALVINSAWNGAIPSATTNVIWMGIALIALIGLHRRPLPPPA